MKVTDLRTVVVGTPWKNWLFVVLETDEGPVPIALEVLRGTPRAVDGVLTVPEGPGLGVELDEVAAARYPYRADHFMHFFEPGWERRFDDRAPGGSGRP